MRTPATLVTLLLITPFTWGRQECDPISTFADHVAPTRVLHVAPHGEDAKAEGTEQRPFGTIRAAVLAATPGTQVLIHPGTYTGGVWLENIRADDRKPIWIGGAPGQTPRPVIEGGGTAIHFARCSGIILHDLEVRGCTQNGVNADDAGAYADETAARHMVFRRLRIDSIGGDGNQDGLKLSGVRRFAVLDCEISRCGGAKSGSGVDMVGCHDGVITGTFFHDLSANAVQAKGGTADVLIARCRMERAGERAVNIGGSTGFEFFRPPLTPEGNAEARRIRVVSNVIIGGGCAAAFVGALDSEFSHNTVLRPEVWTFRILQETTSTREHAFVACARNRVEANIFVFERRALRTHVNIGPNTDPAGFAIVYNCWFAADDPGWSRPSLPVTEVGGMYGVDPMVREDARWTLDPRGPCVGKAPGFPIADYAGKCFRTPAAIGAREAE